MDKKEIIRVAKSKSIMGIKGGFIQSEEFDSIPFDLDGANISKWLKSKGFEILENYDTGGNGLVITKCGISLSTNGFCSTVEI